MALGIHEKFELHTAEQAHPHHGNMRSGRRFFDRFRGLISYPHSVRRCLGLNRHAKPTRKEDRSESSAS
jgi:hypothetical protein